MTTKKITVKIGNVVEFFDIPEDEIEIFKNIQISLNEKLGNLIKNTDGIKINDRILLIIILLINQNKKEKIFDNFEEKLIQLLKSLSKILYDNSKITFDSQLLLSNIFIENETKNITTTKINKESKNDIISLSSNNSNYEINKKYEENIKFLDEIINIVKNIVNKIENI